MSINIQSTIDRLRNESPLLGRNARVYIANVLDALFNAHISHFGSSTTGANIAEKQVLNITPEFDRPDRGIKIAVHFQHANIAANPTLQIGASPPARPIINLSNWPAGTTVNFVFDGTNWRMIDSKRTTNIRPIMDREDGNIGTDNGQYANADHVHPVHIYHDTSHVVTGRFIQARMPTSEISNRVLAVEEAFEDPAYVQVNDEMIANNAVITRTILDRNVTEPKLADNAVVTRTILDLNVTEPKLADNAIVTRTILDRNVTEPKLSDDAIVTRTILDRNITEPKLADNAVITRTILDRNVTEPKLSDDAVATRAILDRNVTEPKLANNAVVTRTILDQNITTPKLANRAVTGDKLFTSTEDNTLLRVNEAGTDPVFGKIQLPTDLDGIMPVTHGGTGADNPEGSRENLGAAAEVDLQAHIENHMAHGRHPVVVYGPYNIHQGAVDITIDENKRLTLATNGNFHAHDDIADYRITSWLQKRVGSAGTSGFQTTIMAGWGNVRIDETTGEDAGFAGFTEAHVFFHRDNTLYKIVVLSWADNSNTTTTRPNVLTRLQNTVIKVEKLLDRPQGWIQEHGAI